MVCKTKEVLPKIERFPSFLSSLVPFKSETSTSQTILLVNGEGSGVNGGGVRSQWVIKIKVHYK